MTGRLKCNYQGWNRLKRKLTSFSEDRSIDVGFFSDSKYGPDNDRLQVAQVAAWNDYGSSTNPPRPFMTVYYMNHVRSVGPEMCRKAFLLLLTKNITEVNNYLKTCARDLADELQEIILDFPGDNSLAWIEQKGFNDPLLHTGHMFDSVALKVRKRSTVIYRQKG